MKPYSSDATECYQNFKNLIYSLSFKFWKQNGGELEEYQSISRLAFMDAHVTYPEKKDKYKFSNWLGLYIWSSMLDFLEKEYKTQRRRPADFIIHCHKKPFIDLVDELSDDAKIVVDLVLDTPEDLTKLIIDTGGEIKHVKKALSSYLQVMGWKIDRIRSAYRQIRVAL